MRVTVSRVNVLPRSQGRESTVMISRLHGCVIEAETWYKSSVHASLPKHP